MKGIPDLKLALLRLRFWLRHSTVQDWKLRCYLTCFLCVLVLYLAVCFSLSHVDSLSLKSNIVPLTDTEEAISRFIQDYAKVVIGLGFPKCGSTYFLHRLSQQSSEQGLPELMGRTLHDELHYWDFCFTHGLLQSIDKSIRTVIESSPLMSGRSRSQIYPVKSNLQCNFEDYIAEFYRFNSSLNHRESSSSPIWLNEKSPSYILNPHVAVIFNEYLRRFPEQLTNRNVLKFYILVRNPVSKLWSNFYRRCRTHWNSKDVRSESDRRRVAENCNRAVPKAVSLFLSNYRRRYAVNFMDRLQRPMQETNVRSLSEAGFRIELAKSYMDFYYKEGLDYHNGMDSMAVFIAGSYILPILAYEYWFTQAGYPSANADYFRRNFRVIRSEDTFDPKQSSSLFRNSLCWVYFDDDLNQCNRGMQGSPESNSSKRRLNAQKHETLKEMPPHLRTKARHFYDSSNQRLYEYLDLFPDLMIDSSKPFTHWW